MDIWSQPTLTTRHSDEFLTAKYDGIVSAREAANDPSTPAEQVFDLLFHEDVFAAGAAARHLALDASAIVRFVENHGDRARYLLPSLLERVQPLPMRAWEFIGGWWGFLSWPVRQQALVATGAPSWIVDRA